jgi:hypothetical protein
MISSRFLAVAAAVGCLLVVASYTGLWYLEASQVRDGIARFIAARATHGMTIRSEKLEIGGFPFTLDADFGRVMVDGLPYAKPVHAEAPSLLLRARPWQPGNWRIVAENGLIVTVPENEGQSFRATAGDARGRAQVESDGLVIGIDCHNITLGSPGSAPAAHHASLRLTVPDKPPEDDTTPSLTFDLVVDRAVLPNGLESPQAGLPDRLSIEGVVEGPVPEEPLVPALTEWRERGGSIELHQIVLRWGAVDLDGDGTLTLDTNLQPAASFTGRIRGWGALLDDLVQAGALTASEANYDRLGFGLLTRTAEDGKSELRAPITLQNTQVYLGKAKVAKVPPIVWQ